MMKRLAHRLDLNSLDHQVHKELYCRLKGEEIETLDIDFGVNSETFENKVLRPI